MFLRGASAAFVTFGLVAACSIEVTSTPAEDRADASTGEDAGSCPPHEREFSYEESETTGPEHWEDLHEACGGTFDGGAVQQSPSAIDPAGPGVGTGDFELRLGEQLRWTSNAAVTSLWNNGHTWQAGFGDPSLSLVASGNTDYVLKQFHVHAPSEHTIGGKEYPLEMHFVHLSATGKPFEATPFAAVVAVMFEEDASGQDNPELAKIWNRFSRCAQDSAEPVSGIGIDLTALLPPDRSYVRYDGSLTTPPCSVTVRFHLLTHSIKVSAAQLSALTRAVGRNDRPLQTRLETTAVTLHAQR